MDGSFVLLVRATQLLFQVVTQLEGAPVEDVS